MVKKSGVKREYAQKMLLESHKQLEFRIKERTTELATTNNNLQTKIIEQKQMEKEIFESNRKIQTLFNNLQGIAYRCKNDDSWTMEFISAGIKDITGYSAEDIIENKKLAFNNIIVPEDRKRIRNEIQLALDTKKHFELNYRIKTVSGKIIFVLEKGIGVFTNDKKKLLALEGFIIDISKRKKAEEELNKYKNQLEKLVKERTSELEDTNKELENKNQELEKYYDLFVGREFRIKELRDEIKELKKNRNM